DVGPRGARPDARVRPGVLQAPLPGEQRVVRDGLGGGLGEVRLGVPDGGGPADGGADRLGGQAGRPGEAEQAVEPELLLDLEAEGARGPGAYPPVSPSVSIAGSATPTRARRGRGRRQTPPRTEVGLDVPESDWWG